jgi:hypothetical protein
MKNIRENPIPVNQSAGLDHIKPCWYWDKRDLAHTPSQSEGLDPATEARYRREGARFIFDVGTRLGLYPFGNQHECVYDCFIARLLTWMMLFEYTPIAVNERCVHIFTTSDSP